MIQMKIFSVLELLKRTDTIRKGHEAETVEKLISEILKDKTNINDAYVTLDFLNKVTGQVLESMKTETIQHIQESGDDEALGVQLVVEATKVPDYDQDKDWSEINRKVLLFSDARTKREKTLTDLTQSNSTDEQSKVKYSTVLSILPRHINQ